MTLHRKIPLTNNNKTRIREDRAAPTSYSCAKRIDSSSQNCISTQLTAAAAEAMESEIAEKLVSILSFIILLFILCCFHFPPVTTTSHRPTMQSRRRRYASHVVNSCSNSCGVVALCSHWHRSRKAGLWMDTCIVLMVLPHYCHCMPATLARPADGGNAKANHLCSLPVNRGRLSNDTIALEEVSWK